jgi:hypothetical protein
LQEQTMRLQWFKELIFQPNKQAIEDFFNNLKGLKEKIDSDELSEDKIQELLEFIKQQDSFLQKRFVDVLPSVNKKLHEQVKTNIENLVSNLTDAIANGELKLSKESVYAKEIGSKIIYSKNDLTKLLYQYKGTIDAIAVAKTKKLGISQ